jgi:outer membrane murein-binding lipoprotein Lpp
MWLLAWVPDSFLLWVIHTVLLAGIVGTVLSFFLLHRIVRWFPALAPYHLLIQIVSVTLLVGGVYFKGGYDTEASWRAKVAELESQVAKMNDQSEELNKKLEDERKKKQKVRVEYYNTVKTEIKEVEKQINADCKLDPKVNELINKAAKNPEAK